MKTIIDFNKLKRLPNQSDIDLAQEKLEERIPYLIQARFEELKKMTNKPTIDYTIADKDIDGKYPRLQIWDSWLPAELKDEICLIFYNQLFEIVNKED